MILYMYIAPGQRQITSDDKTRMDPEDSIVLYFLYGLLMYDISWHHQQTLPEHPDNVR